MGYCGSGLALGTTFGLKMAERLGRASDTCVRAQPVRAHPLPGACRCFLPPTAAVRGSCRWPASGSGSRTAGPVAAQGRRPGGGERLDGIRPARGRRVTQDPGAELLETSDNAALQGRAARCCPRSGPRLLLAPGRAAGDPAGADAADRGLGLPAWVSAALLILTLVLTALRGPDRDLPAAPGGGRPPDPPRPIGTTARKTVGMLEDEENAEDPDPVRLACRRTRRSAAASAYPRTRGRSPSRASGSEAKLRSRPAASGSKRTSVLCVP